MNRLDKQLIGWLAAAVLGAALIGVIIYNVVSDDGGKSAQSNALANTSSPLGNVSNAQGPPPDVAEDVKRILDEKNRVGKDKVPDVPPGQQGPRLDTNPEDTCDPSLPPNAFPEWKNNPGSLGQAKAMANKIVVGEVTGVETGQELRADAPGEPGGVVVTPVQNVTVRVTEGVKGSSKAGDTITIQRLGDDRGCFRAAGDPPYSRAEQVLLLLEDGVGGRPPHALSPAGRYKVAADRLQAVEDNPIASEVRGQKLDQVLAKLRGP
jgi:hypothetical protein